MTIRNISVNDLLNFVNKKNNSNEFFFGQKMEEDKWNLPINSTNSLDFNNFDITWAYTPRDGASIKDRLDLCDSLEYGSLRAPFPTSKYSKYNYRFENNYHLLDNVPVDHMKDFGKNKKVLYKYNTEWFRCDNFKKDHDGIHILFHGCSNTEGIGANIEDTWSHMLYSELSKKYKTSGYYNIGRSGSGWHRMIQNFITYVNKYGAPDYLFILHPNILRTFIWQEERNAWRYEQLNPWGDTTNLDQNIALHRDHFPVWAISWKLFIEYCKSVGTEIIWSTWDVWEIKNIQNSNFFNDTFFKIDRINNEIVKEKYLEFVTREDAVWARDGHDGYIQQYHWFKSFLNEIDKRGMINGKG